MGASSGFRATVRPLLLLFSFSFFLWIGGCARVQQIPSPAALEPIEPAAYPEFRDDLYFDGIEHALSQSLSYLRSLPASQTFAFGKDAYSAPHLIRSLETFSDFIRKNPDRKTLNAFIRSRFRVYRSPGTDGSGRVLFTGYYEPELAGSLRPSEAYRYPVHALPDDLIRVDLSRFSPRWSGETLFGRYAGRELVPYFDRKEIEAGEALRGGTEVLAWVRDRIDLFFLHIQGSGKIFLDDGTVLKVHYHGANGRPYRSIGKYLIDNGKIASADISMQTIRAYLREHPEEIDAVLWHNPSYVFFKLEPDGPLGSLGKRLTPGRSIALDRKIFPAGGLAFITAQQPLVDGGGEISAWTDLSRFALNQDTGGAITGAGRADLFFGEGEYARSAAGHLKHPGKLYFLVLKPQ